MSMYYVEQISTEVSIANQLAPGLKNLSLPALKSSFASGVNINNPLVVWQKQHVSRAVVAASSPAYVSTGGL